MDSNIKINGITLKKFRPYIYERTDGFYFVLFCLTDCTLLYVYDKMSNWDGLKEEIVIDDYDFYVNRNCKFKNVKCINAEAKLIYFIEHMEDFRKMTFSDYLSPNGKDLK